MAKNIGWLSINSVLSIRPTHKSDAMTTKKKSGVSHSAKGSGAVKTIRLRLAVTEPDLQQSVEAAFELAKSGGRELDLAFVSPVNKPGGTKPDSSPRARG